MSLLHITVGADQSGDESIIWNLQDCLLACLPPGDIYKLGVAPNDTEAKLNKLAADVGFERRAPRPGVGAATLAAIRQFQLQEGIELPANRVPKIDDRTANKLNEYLDAEGFFDPDDTFTVFGRVTRASATGPAVPAVAVTVQVFDPSGSRETRLDRTLADASGNYEIKFEFTKVQSRWVGVPTSKGFRVSQQLQRNPQRRMQADLVLPAAPGPTNYKVDGHVTRPLTDPDPGAPVPNVQVNALDVTVPGASILLGSATTDTTGRYEIAFSALVPPTLMSAAVDAAGNILAQSSTASNPPTSVTLDVELPEAVAPADFTVFGKVTGLPATGAFLVRAFDKDMRNEQPLGDCVPGSGGSYEIHYQRALFARAEKASADVIVRVFDGTKALNLDRKGVTFNVPSRFEHDVTVVPDQAVSEYDRYVAEVDPLREGVPVAQFTEDDLDFLAGETGLDRLFLSWLNLAARLALAGVPPEAFYGWFREGLPTELATLAQTDIVKALAKAGVPTLRQGLLDAIDAAIIPAALRGQVEAILTAMPIPGRDAMVTVFTPQAAAALGERVGKVNEVDNTLVAQLVQRQTLAADAALNVGLAVTLNNLRVSPSDAVVKFSALTFDHPAGHTLECPRDLAALSVDDWKDGLTKAGAQVPNGMSLDAYAAQLVQAVASAFQTDALLYAVTDTRPFAAAWRALAPATPEGARALLDRARSAHLAHAERDEATPHLMAVHRLMNLHPGFPLRDKLVAAATPEAAVAEVQAAVNWVRDIHQLNLSTPAAAGVDLLAVDYLPESESLKNVKFGTAPADVKDQVVATFKTYQRVHATTGDAVASVALAAQGYSTAASLSQAHASEIVAKTGLTFDAAAACKVNATRLSDAAAISWFALHDNARDNLVFGDGIGPGLPSGFLQQIEGYADMFGSIDRCACDPCFSVLSPAAYFVDLMRYIETKILDRPYKLAEDGIDLPLGLPEKHPLHLRARRPDLWDSLTLTCDNTNDSVPTLDIVNGILEPFIQQGKALASRNALYEFLAGHADSAAQPFSLPLVRLNLLLKHFELDRGRIAQVLHGPAPASKDAQDVVTRSRLGLSWKAMDIVTQSRVSDVPAGVAHYERWVGEPITGPAALDPDQPIDRAIPRSLMRAAGIEHDALVSVAASRFVNVGVTAALPPVKLTPVMTRPGNVGPDAEYFQYLTLRRLDRLETFLRLRKACGWSIAELDHVLARMSAATPPVANAPPVSTLMLAAIAQMLDFQARWQISVEELCALIDLVPSVPLLTKASLWDQRFNLAPFVQAGGPLPANPPQDLLPAALADDGKALPNATMSQRLVAALQVTEAELVALFVGLEARMTGAPVVQGKHRAVPLTADNLTLLYRHARLSRALNLTPEQLFGVMGLLPVIAQRQAADRTLFTELDDLVVLVKTRDWIAASSFGLGDVLRLCEPRVTTDAHKALALVVVQQVRDEGALTFADTVFTQIGLSDAHSRALVATNSGAADSTIEPVAGANAVPYRVRSTFDWLNGYAAFKTGNLDGASIAAWLGAAILAIAARADFGADAFTAAGLTPAQSASIVAANVNGVDARFEAVLPALTPPTYRLRTGASQALTLTLPADEVALVLKRQCCALLRAYDPRTVLTLRLSALLKRPLDRTLALCELATAGQSILDAVAVAVRGGNPAPLADFIATVQPLAAVLADPVFDAQAIRFSAEDINPFQFGASVAVSLETLRRVSLYTDLAAPADTAFQPEAARRDAGKLQSLVRRTAIDAADATDVAAALASTTSIVAPLLTALTGLLGRTLKGLDGLDAIRAGLAVIQPLGINAEVLVEAVTPVAAVAAEHQGLMKAADGVYGLFRTKYPDATTFLQKLEPFDDQLRSLTRTALVDCLLNDATNADWQARFRSADDLYNHFLMDVLVEGCARTSRLVAGISSAQLYVHRVLMHVEVAAAIGTTPAVVLGFGRDAFGRAAAAEWAWRKQYRVWEANRKVFLYPENYVEPGLRDNKTPLFQSIEEALLQRAGSAQSVLDAYTDYLHGLDEIANLRVSGAYHDHFGDGNDILYLFGATSADPPIHYFRKIQNIDSTEPTVYGAWQKIDLQIPVRNVSPIVFDGRLYVFWIEMSTRPLTGFENGSSTFKGYRHSVRMKYSQLRLDGRWTPPQEVRMPRPDGGVSAVRAVEDPVQFVMQTTKLPGTNLSITLPVSQYLFWDTRNRDAKQPLDDYAPEGWKWDRVYPALTMDGTTVTCVFAPKGNDPLLARPPVEDRIDFATRSATDAPVADTTLSKEFLVYDPGSSWLYAQTRPYSANVQPFFTSTLKLHTPDANTVAQGTKLIQFNAGAELQFLNGDSNSVLLGIGGDSLLLRRRIAMDHPYELRRLGTTLLPTMAWLLASRGGVDTLLATSSQAVLKEAPVPVGLANLDQVVSRFSEDPYHPDCALATYIREIYFHIPFLLADSLHSQEKFDDARRWYQYIFDPTATDEPGGTAQQRPWRYREFRQDNDTTLQASLTDPDALARYRQDPFNPHAIARLRPGAYQKAVVMKYVDNLLDWGDRLFTQFTMESVNEASMLYMMASNVLGPAPATLGPCEELAGNTVKPLTYADIRSKLFGSTEILLQECELLPFKPPKGSLAHVTGNIYVPQSPFLQKLATTTTLASLRPSDAQTARQYSDPVSGKSTGAGAWSDTKGTSSSSAYDGDPPPVGTGSKAPPTPSPAKVPTPAAATIGMLQPETILPPAPPLIASPAQLNLLDVAQSKFVFCLPDNDTLRGYWGRVADRLYKIRNCLDIEGVRRTLELFAPEIDPALLVRMRAEGLSLDDILTVSTGDLPPYRFQYLIDKAKQYVGVVQTFSAQLASALEKKDAEELALLRATHEQNLLTLRKSELQWEIDAANDTWESLKSQQASAQYRHDYFVGLSASGLNAQERVAQTKQGESKTANDLASTMSLLGSVCYLIPQLGAFTALKFGGKELGDAASTIASGASAIASAAEVAVRAASAQATFNRRDDDWKHQAAVANFDVIQLKGQIAAADIRRSISEKALEVHERTIEQSQEVFEAMRSRFSNFGRYTWLSEQLHKLNREAFSAALSMAQLAERAYRYERSDGSSDTLLHGSYWSADNAGLLAGERLMLDLQNIERRYIETNYRTLEIEQSFSLLQFDPQALIQLRKTGSCRISVPEVFFDIVYPGQYRRRIKAVRLTIPCVVGPYGSVGAVLTLNSSAVRSQPKYDAASLVPVTLRHLTTVASSSAQNDSGVFEFSFRDERYMPFEGAGAVSEWTLKLPTGIRTFDYETIADVILRIAYTAIQDPDATRADQVSTAVLKEFQTKGITRIFSLRNEFPMVWSQLLRNPIGTDVPLTITSAHLPFFLSGFELIDTAVELVLELADSADPAKYPDKSKHPPEPLPTFKFNGTVMPEFTAADPNAPDYVSRLRFSTTAQDHKVVATHTIVLQKAGDLATAAPPPNLDDTVLADIHVKVLLRPSKT